MNLLQLMQEISDHKVQYKITVGDFNLPHINWNYCTSTMGQHDIHTLFLEKVRDCFFTQHITDITRFRGDSIGNTLDLLFTNDESIIETIKIDNPLGKSDHACIYFQCDLQEWEDRSKKLVYMYEKGNYQLIKNKLTVYGLDSVLSTGGIYSGREMESI